MLPRNDDYTTENLLDFSYHRNYYRLTGIDLLRQANASIPQQITFVEKLKKMMVQQCFLLLKSSINQF